MENVIQFMYMNNNQFEDIMENIPPYSSYEKW